MAEDFISLDDLQSHSVKRYYRRTIRSQLKQSFNGECAYCGREHNHLTLDHCIPRSKGGRNCSENLVPCCTKCNGKKGNEMPYEWYSRQEFFSLSRWNKILDHVGEEERMRAIPDLDQVA